MKKHLLKSLLALALVLITGNAWGEDETLTISGKSSGNNAPWGTSYGNGTGKSLTSENAEIGISWTNVGRMTTSIQIKAGTSNGFWSTSVPTGKVIKSIEITEKTNSVNLLVSADGTNWTELVNISTTTTTNYTVNDGYKYFKVMATSSYAQISEIIVTYVASTPAKAYTVTLDGSNESLTETSVGAGVTLPSKANKGSYIFEGWCETNILKETANKPVVIPAGTYHPTDDITLYPVFSYTSEAGEHLEQTLEYDTWTYSGATTNKSGYRLFHSDSYVESEAFDLSKLKKVIVYGGTFGGANNNQLTIGDGTNTWKSVTVSGSSETGKNIYTDEGCNALSGTKKLRITSNSGSTSGDGVRISKIEIYNIGTITYVSIVPKVLSGVTIKNAPAKVVYTEGETFDPAGLVITATYSDESIEDVAYSDETKNDFSFTPDLNTALGMTNTSVEINYVGKTCVQNITVEEGAKYIVTIDNDQTKGAVSADMTEAAAGVQVTLTITPADHYKLASLNVTDANEQLVTVTDNKFTMPASNVTVSAEFVEKTKYMVTYANTQRFEMVYEGEKADVPVLESLRGWDFAGWTTNLNYTASTTAPTLFDGTVTGSTTLMAVYKKTEVGAGNPEWHKVTSEPADWSGKYLIVFEGAEVNSAWVSPKALNGSLSALDVTDNGLDVTISDNKVIAVNSDNEGAYFTIAKNNTGYSITSASGLTIGNEFKSGSTTQNALKTGAYVNSISMTDDSQVEIGCASTTLRFNAMSNQMRFRYYGANQQPVYLYKYVTGDATTYSLYPSYTVNISSVGFATFYSKKAVTIPEGVTAYYAAYENKTITLNQVQGEVIHQGEGVVLKGEGGSYEFVPTSDVMEDAPNNALFGKEVESEYADLADDGTYVYTLNVGSNGVSFYHMSNTSSLAANRAYMLIPVTDFEDGAGTIGFRFGDATQIENVNAVEVGKYYDLMGREVLNPNNGIYILNGKKVLVK